MTFNVIEKEPTGATALTFTSEPVSIPYTLAGASRLWEYGDSTRERLDPGILEVQHHGFSVEANYAH